MPSYYDKMLDVLRDASIAYVAWRMFHDNNEGDLVSIEIFGETLVRASDGGEVAVRDIASRHV
jgi:hypothetical protein